MDVICTYVSSLADVSGMLVGVRELNLQICGPGKRRNGSTVSRISVRLGDGRSVLLVLLYCSAKQGGRRPAYT